MFSRFNAFVLLAVTFTTLILPSCRAFLLPARGMIHAQQCSGSRHGMHGTLPSRRASACLRMTSDENGAMENGAATMNDVVEEAKRVVQSPMNTVVGPSMQPEEEKKKEREAAMQAKPETNKWASGAFKRGVALQAVVLLVVIILQFQPKEVTELGICPPFVNQGCVSFLDWVRIVFLGAPIPPM